MKIHGAASHSESGEETLRVRYRSSVSCSTCFQIFTLGICARRAGKLYRARSRLKPNFASKCLGQWKMISGSCWLSFAAHPIREYPRVPYWLFFKIYAFPVISKYSCGNSRRDVHNTLVCIHSFAAHFLNHETTQTQPWTEGGLRLC